MGILNRKVSFRLFAVGLILVLAVIFTAVCVPVFQEDIRETGRAAVREAVLRSAVECYTLEGAYPESLEYLEKHYGLLTITADGMTAGAYCDGGGAA